MVLFKINPEPPAIGSIVMLVMGLEFNQIPLLKNTLVNDPPAWSGRYVKPIAAFSVEPVMAGITKKTGVNAALGADVAALQLPMVKFVNPQVAVEDTPLP
jgi:hypothetical protein